MFQHTVIKKIHPEQANLVCFWCTKNFGDLGYNWDVTVEESYFAQKRIEVLRFKFKHSDDWIKFLLTWP